MKATTTHHTLSNGYRYNISVAEGEVGEPTPEAPPVEPGFVRESSYYNVNVTRGSFGIWIDVEVFKR